MFLEWMMSDMEKLEVPIVISHSGYVPFLTLQELPQERSGLLKGISEGLHCTSACAECVPEDTEPRPVWWQHSH